jgi:hypothetical protein
MGGLGSLVTATDPFVMQYADGFPTNAVGWGRLTLDTLSQQTRLITFSNLLNKAIGPEYVQRFEEEIPPGMLNSYTATNPTNVTASVSGNTLTIAWPADHLGWILHAQTNGLSPDQWFDLSGTSDVNLVAIPINPANQAVFYRLRRP